MTSIIRCDYCGTALNEEDPRHTVEQCREYVKAALNATKRALSALQMPGDEHVTGSTTQDFAGNLVFVPDPPGDGSSTATSSPSTCSWYDEDDEGAMRADSLCGEPATHYSCNNWGPNPTGLNACKKHKCRCAPPVRAKAADSSSPAIGLRRAWDVLHTEISRIKNTHKTTALYEAINDIEGAVRAVEGSLFTSQEQKKT